MFENLNSYLSKYVNVARRCVLLNCVPVGVARLLALFERHCGAPKRAFYWPDKQRKGVLLLEADSVEALDHGLCRIPGFMRLATGDGKTRHHQCGIIELPPFRICSDPSRWALPPYKTNIMEPHGFDELNLELQRGLPSTKALHAKLMQCTSISDQAALLHELTRLTYPEMLARFVVSDSLQEILSFIRPETEVSVFGSAVDGLGTSSSDLDLVINVSKTISPSLSDVTSFECPRRALRLNAHFPLIPSLIVSNMKLKPIFLSLLRCLLFRLDPLGFNNTRIFSGRVPILHIPHFNLLGVGIDISRVFEGVPETGKTVNFHDGRTMAALMRLLTACVPEFPRCITVLKFISRRGELTHQGPNPGFTNFKLTVLFIHFLQAHGYAPSFDRINSLTRDLSARDPDHPLLLDDLRPLPSIDVLLEQFFTYIPTINPSHFLISLRAGRLVSRVAAEHLLEPCAQLSVHADDYDNMDPFDYSFSDQDYLMCPNPIRCYHNMLRGIGENDWVSFVRVCEQWQKTLRTHTQSPSPWGLLALKKDSIHHNETMVSVTGTSTTTNDSESDCTISSPPLFSYLC